MNAAEQGAEGVSFLSNSSPPHELAEVGWKPLARRAEVALSWRFARIHVFSTLLVWMLLTVARSASPAKPIVAFLPPSEATSSTTCVTEHFVPDKAPSGKELELAKLGPGNDRHKGEHGPLLHQNCIIMSP